MCPYLSRQHRIRFRDNNNHRLLLWKSTASKNSLWIPFLILECIEDDYSTLLNGPDLITRIGSQRETSKSKKRLLDSTNNTPTNQALSNKASRELSDRRGILSRRRSRRSIGFGCLISLLMPAPRSGCLDLGKGVGCGPRLHKRRLYELRGYEHICEYEYICELRGYE